MAELKGSQTEKNLLAAFAGESQAFTKYNYYASKAKKDGYVQIGKLFEETANNEKEHAKIWRSRAARRSVRISTRATSTATVSGRCGRTVFFRSATGSGRGAGSAPRAGCSNIASAAGCTSTATTANSSIAITSGFEPLPPFRLPCSPAAPLLPSAPASRPGCRLLCPVAASPLSGLRFFAGSLCDFRAPEAL